MQVEVWLKETSQPIKRSEVINVYTKGLFYCIQVGNKVEKFPVANIWRVVESYDG